MASPHSPFTTFTTSAFALNQFATNHVIREKTTQEELIKAAATSETFCLDQIVLCSDWSSTDL